MKLNVWYGIFEIDSETNLARFLAMYPTATEARANIPRDKKFYFINPIFSSYERTDFTMGETARLIKTF